MFEKFKKHLQGKSNKGERLYVNAIPIDEVSEDGFIKIVPVGVFPMHHNGGHEVTAEHVAEMAENFQTKSTDLLVDWEHNSLWGDTKAAGWIEEVEARDDGLYVKYPKFTPTAEDQITNREYRYFSPVYKLESASKKGEDQGALIDSVALTNRPYFDEDEINAIGNSDSFTPAKEDTSNQNKPTDMKLNTEALAKLGLDENATEEEINEAIMNSQAAPGGADDDDGGKVEGGGLKENSEASTQKPESDAKTNSDTVSREEFDAFKEERKKEKVDTLINSAINQGKILPKQKKAYEAFANSDFEGCKKELDEMKANSSVPASVKVNNKDEENDDPRAKTSAAFRNSIVEKTPHLAKQ